MEYLFLKIESVYYFHCYYCHRHTHPHHCHYDHRYFHHHHPLGNNLLLKLQAVKRSTNSDFPSVQRTIFVTDSPYKMNRKNVKSCI
jgi:hypothetical protein